MKTVTKRITKTPQTQTINKQNKTLTPLHEKRRKQSEKERQRKGKKRTRTRNWDNKRAKRGTKARNKKHGVRTSEAPEQRQELIRQRATGTRQGQTAGRHHGLLIHHAAATHY